MKRSDRPEHATMEDVAQVAGVSRMTVSRALREDGAVSRGTRERILGIASDMNYVPNQMAGSLTTRRSGFLATLVPSLNNDHYAEMVQTFTAAIETTGMQILLGHTDYSIDREEKLVESMLKRRPEAIALSYDGHSSRTVKLLKHARIPVIELWEVPPEPIDFTIGFSNERASYDMTQKLTELGYQNIAFLCETNDEWSRGALRRQGYRKAMADAGLSAHRMIRFGDPPLSIRDGYFVGKNLDRYYDDIDAVFCVSDLPAFGLLTALRESGINVPNDVGVAGFGNFEVSRYAMPAISTVQMDPVEVGRLAAELVIKLHDSDTDMASIEKCRTVGMSLDMRDSTRKVD